MWALNPFYIEEKPEPADSQGFLLFLPECSIYIEIQYREHLRETEKPKNFVSYIGSQLHGENEETQSTLTISNRIGKGHETHGYEGREYFCKVIPVHFYIFRSSWFLRLQGRSSSNSWNQVDQRLEE